MTEDCLICDVDNEVVRSNLIFENEQVIAFLYLHPLTLGHTVVAPRKHFRSLFEINDPKVFGEILTLTQSVYRKMQDVLRANGMNLVSNNGKSAGQEVSHFHLHVIPRKSNDGLGFVRLSGKKVREPTKQAFSELLEKLTISRQ